MKKGAMIPILAMVIVFAGWGQTFEWPPINNTVQSVEKAFLALLLNIDSLGKQSLMAESIRDYNTHERYIKYLDFVLDNMTYDKVKNYFEFIKQSADGIDYLDLSKTQQGDFEYFLNTAHVDSWTFGIGGDRWTFYPLPSSLPLVFEGTPITEDIYRNNLHKNINNFHEWEAFFEDKNTMVRDLLILTDVKGHLTKIIDDEVPQRTAPAYLEKLSVFLEGWGL